jgi:hypothetical protein
MTLIEETYDTRGALSEEDAHDYMRVTRMAWEVHVDRERLRNALWKQYSCRDQAVQIRTKIDRALNALDLLAGSLTEPMRADVIANMVEEFADIINYANFAIRIAEGTT